MTDCIETNLSPRACLLRKCPLVFVSRISLNKNKKIVKHSEMKTNLEKPDIYPLNIWRTIIRQLGTIVCAFMMTWWLNLTKQLLVYYFNFTFNNLIQNLKFKTKLQGECLYFTKNARNHFFKARPGENIPTSFLSL